MHLHLKFRSKLLIFLSSLALSCPAAFANIYRIDLNNYSIDFGTSDLEGTLSGFIVIDTSLVNGDPTFNNTGIVGLVDIPSWITSASMTFTRTGGSAEGSPGFTKTMTDSIFPIDEMNWRVKQTTVDNGGFDPSQEFVSQMETFALFNGAELTGNPNAAQTSEHFMIQQFYSSEALLESPINSTPVPGPLPILGLAPLAWYFRKLKKKLVKN